MSEIGHIEFLVPSASGRVMAADMFLSDQPKALVVYAHGINGFKDWGGMDLIAKEFAQAGLAFFKFNFSHNGTTLADKQEFVDLEAYGKDNYSLRQSDLAEIGEYVRSEQFPINNVPIILLGHSRGGVDALIYAGEHPDLGGLITWAAPSNVQTPWSRWDDELINAWERDGVTYLKNGRTGQEMPLYYQLREDVLNNADRFDLKRAAASLGMPWLIAHGTEDEAVSVEQSKELVAMSNGRADLLSLDGAGHTFGRKHPWLESELPEHSQQLVDESIRWITKKVIQG